MPMGMILLILLLMEHGKLYEALNINASKIFNKVVSVVKISLLMLLMVVQEQIPLITSEIDVFLRRYLGFIQEYLYLKMLLEPRTAIV